MKLIRIPTGKLWVLALLLLSDTFANSIIAGGQVPERRNLSVTPAFMEQSPWFKEKVEIATLVLDNNLPNYQLVLDFTDKDRADIFISEVHLQGLDGILGQGLSMNGETILKAEPGSNRFVWNPGPQQTATLNFQIRVLVVYKQAPASTPRMTVSMPSFY